MSRHRLDYLFYIDDSDDEYFITKILLEKSNISIILNHYYDPDSFFSTFFRLEKDAISKSLIIFDLNLTATSGLDAIRQLRSDQRFSRVRAGICTGSEDPADRENAMTAGADFFVAKPLDMPCLERICSAVGDINLVAESGGTFCLMRTNANQP